MAPAGRQRREIKPTGGYHWFRLAIERAGAVEFCAPCYCYVMPGHTCPSWTLAAVPARPTLVKLEGGLTSEVA